MNILKWFTPRSDPQANCDHRYIYRSLDCTKCGKTFDGIGEPEFTPHIIRNGKPVPAHDDMGTIRQRVKTTEKKEESALKCTYCGGNEFRGGPEGGMSQNVLCANPDCRHWFNWTPMLNKLDDLNRIEPMPKEKEEEQRRRDLKLNEELAEQFKIGADTYRDGSATAMRLVQRSKGWTSPRHEHLDQLAGFIDAMCDDIRTLREASTLMLNTGAAVLSVPAYGPGSITDPARYDQPLPADIAERVEPIHRATAESLNRARAMESYLNRIADFAKFCAFLDGYDGHPADGFKTWMKKQDCPLTAIEETHFDTVYHKEE